MQVKSSAFNNGERIPQRYSFDGEDISPPLAWFEAPADTRSFAIFCDDPDAPGGMFHHWAMYDIPRTTTEVPEGFATRLRVASCCRARTTSAMSAMVAPARPRGTLDCGHLDTHGKTDAAEIEALAQQHCIGQGEVVDLYSR